MGFDGGCLSGALAERPVPNSGVVVGGDGGTEVRWLSRKGGKAPAAKGR